MMKQLFKAFLTSCIFIFSASSIFAQAPNNWFLMETIESGYPGANIQKAYKSFSNQKSPDTVIVAVIDSGTDYIHEDLASVTWVNTKEIAGDGIDNDGNGYIDDIHGWSFLGGKEGDVSKETLEITRVYAALSKKYADTDRASLSKNDREKYDYYLNIKSAYETKRDELKLQYETLKARKQPLLASLDSLKSAFGSTSFSVEALESLDLSNREAANNGRVLMGRILDSGEEVNSISEVKDLVNDQFKQILENFSGQLDYGYNPDFNARKVVGDDPNNVQEQFYGNNTVKGPGPSHGTHVSGIIAANRNNELGMQGVANAVKLMAVRTVPDGDERDKDVANAIKYAVDNGAKVINMSFGKAYSPNKQAVDDAMKYAEENDVLLVLAAGNSGQNIDETPNYPNGYFLEKKLFKPKKAKNLITVGAVGPSVDVTMAASFSNYGKATVDIFAPGHIIFSTLPENEYGNNSGTSMAAPMVAGVAAMIRSYYPNLSVKQVKEAILKGAYKIDFEVNLPGSLDKKVRFSELCTTGGILDAYAAMEYASKM